MSFSTLSNLYDYLTATPYGKSPAIEENEFYDNDYFIEPKSWKAIANDMVSFYNNIAGNRNTNTVLLYGYQGTGKTTFINWLYKKHNTFMDYDKLILDMEKVPHGAVTNDPHSIFDTYFRTHLNDAYNDNPNDVLRVLNLLLDNFSALRSTTFTRSDNNNRNIFWNKLIDLKISSNALNISTIIHPDIADAQLIANFFDELKYPETFLLFMLLYLKTGFFSEDYGYSKYSPDNSKQKMLIAFDNIDGVRMEQTNAKFPATIADLYNQLNHIFRTFSMDFPSLKFIFAVRDFNYSLLELQTSDSRQTREFYFDPPDNINDIMKKRVEKAKSTKSQYDNAHKVLEIFFEDEKFRDIFLPLFNYNIRKLAESFSEIYEDFKSDSINEYLDIRKNLEEVKDDDLDKAYKNGLRGIFYFLIIKALLKRDTLKALSIYEAGVEVGRTENKSITVNPSRILLTIIHSLTEYTDSEGNKVSRFVGLGTVYNEYRRMFNGPQFVDTYFNKLAELFLLFKNNWCHLISFRNKQVFDDTVFINEKLELKEKVSSTNIQSSDFDFLNNIEVSINRSAHVYLTKVAVHYEFYSIRTQKQENNDCLFLFNDDKCLRNIDNVWEIVEPCLLSLINYLKITNIVDFEDTPLCLKNDFREFSRKTTMAFRIIHTHLRYIDNFRKYIYFRHTKTKKIADFRELNKKIVERQKRYIDKLNELCIARPDRYDDRKEEFNYNYTRQNELGYSSLISMLSDRRDLEEL